MDVQYQRSTRQIKAVCLWQPIIWIMAAMLRDSVVVVVVVRTRPRAIPLAKIVMRKSTHGFPSLFYTCLSMGLRLAALWAAGAPLKRSKKSKRKRSEARQKGLRLASSFTYNEDKLRVGMKKNGDGEGVGVQGLCFRCAFRISFSINKKCNGIKKRFTHLIFVK